MGSVIIALLRQAIQQPLRIVVRQPIAPAMRPNGGAFLRREGGVLPLGRVSTHTRTGPPTGGAPGRVADWLVRLGEQNHTTDETEASHASILRNSTTHSRRLPGTMLLAMALVAKPNHNKRLAVIL